MSFDYWCLSKDARPCSRFQGHVLSRAPSSKDTVWTCVKIPSNLGIPCNQDIRLESTGFVMSMQRLSLFALSMLRLVWVETVMSVKWESWSSQDWSLMRSGTPEINCRLSWKLHEPIYSESKELFRSSEVHTKNFQIRKETERLQVAWIPFFS